MFKGAFKKTISPRLFISKKDICDNATKSHAGSAEKEFDSAFYEDDELEENDEDQYNDEEEEKELDVLFKDLYDDSVSFAKARNEGWFYDDETNEVNEYDSYDE